MDFRCMRVYWEFICVSLLLRFSVRCDEKTTPDPARETLPVLYMSDHCQVWFTQYNRNNHHLDIDSSSVVELVRFSSNSGAGFNMQCVVTFAARRADQRILLHFESMDINYNPGTIDRLRVFDGYQVNYHNQLSPTRGLYGKYYKGVYEFSSGGIHDYTSSGPALTLYFEGTPSPAFSGFKSLLTVFTNAYSNGSCGEASVKCLITNYCIPKSLLCNGYQNCGQGDRTDIDNCEAHRPANKHKDYQPEYTSDLGLMVGCAISIVILMVVVLWLGIVCLKRTKFSTSSQPRYTRRSPGPEEVEGSVVEPVHPRHFLSPILSFFEPPPLYSETSDPSCSGPVLPPRFEPPPPYTSTLDVSDTAGLIVNESSENMYHVSREGLVQNPPRVLEADCADSEEVLLATEATGTDTSDRSGNRQCHGVALATVGQNPRKKREDTSTPQSCRSPMPRAHQQGATAMPPGGRKTLSPNDESQETDSLTINESQS